MINLIRIFSESGLFEEVEFKRGLNIILGLPSGFREGRELNGVGKSTLVRLVDFAFLSDSARKTFSKERCDFLRNEEHSFTLEFKDEESSYRIRRQFARPKVVEFQKDGSSFKEYTEQETKDILAPITIIDQEYDGYVDSDWYRTLMRFFLTDDKSAHSRTDPLNFSHSSTRKPLMWVLNYYLLNLPNKEIVSFDILRQRLREEQTHSKRIAARIMEESGRTIEQARSDVDRIESKIEEYKSNLDSFNFLDDLSGVEEELRAVTTEVSQRMIKYNAVKRRLTDLERSYKLRIDVDVERVQRIYASLQAELAKFVTKKLDEVIEFRREIVANRKKFLVERERRLRTELGEIESDMKTLDERRSQLYRWLKEQKALDSIRNAYERITQESERYERSAARLRSLDDEEQKIAETNTEIADAIFQIVNERKEYDEAVRDIRKIFDDILKNTVYVDEELNDAFLNITTRNRKASPINFEIEVPKSDSLGKSRFKIPVYDLTVFLRLIRQMRDLPHFLFHDGAFNGVASKTVVRFLNYIETKSEDLPTLQYIVTLNEEQVHLSELQLAEFEGMSFDLNEKIIAHYGDIPNKMIFGREF